MTLDSDPAGQDQQTPNGEAESSEHPDQPENTVASRPTPNPEPEPRKRHYEITCKAEKNWWDKVKPFIEVAGLILLAVYTAYTIKMYRANKESADAAEKAANTAQETLLNQQKTFEIDQRPYIVSDVPQFVTSPAPDTAIEANINFKNIGRTPALHYVSTSNLLRFDPSPNKGPGATARFARFINSAFSELERQNLKDRKVLERFKADQDLAPNGSIFRTNEPPLVIPSGDFPRLATSSVSLYYIGVIHYADAFGNTYETEVCWYYFGTDPRTWHICDSHNTIR